MRSVNPYVEIEIVFAGAQRHHDFFQRCVAGALTQAVDRALDLPRTADHDPGQRIGNRHAKVVMTMHRPDCLIRIRNPLPHGFQHIAVQLRHTVADRIGEVDSGGAFGNHRLQYPAQEIHVGATGIFGAEFDIVGELPRKTH